MDLRNTIIEMLRIPQLGNMATITLDGKPWTRYVMLKSGNDLTIRSAIALNSRKVEQVEKNPEVHLTFGINNPLTDMSKPYVQIQGKARISTDAQDKLLYWFEMLEMVFDGPEDPNYAVMIIEPYYIEYMNPGSIKPEIWTCQQS